MSLITATGIPSHEIIKCESGRKIIRFDKLNNLLWYDNRENNPRGIGFQNWGEPNIDNYKKQRFSINETKKKILAEAKRSMSIDKDFQNLIHKSKSDKRKAVQNKYGGSFLPVEYAKNSDYMFERYVPGKKATVLNMAFQVGMLSGGDYGSGFIKILKTILMAQAMNIRCNIDMFDSDTSAVPGNGGYIIVNLARSTEKIDFNKLLISSHQQFFNFTLFNGYSAQNLNHQYQIGTFLSNDKIIKDLNPYYEVIGGNFLHQPEDPTQDSEQREMVNQLFKIAWK